MLVGRPTKVFAAFSESVLIEKNLKNLASTYFKKPIFLGFFIYINRAKQTKKTSKHFLVGIDKEHMGKMSEKNNIPYLGELELLQVIIFEINKLVSAELRV